MVLSISSSSRRKKRGHVCQARDTAMTTVRTHTHFSSLAARQHAHWLAIAEDLQCGGIVQDSESDAVKDRPRSDALLSAQGPSSGDMTQRTTHQPALTANTRCGGWRAAAADAVAEDQPPPTDRHNYESKRQRTKSRASHQPTLHVRRVRESAILTVRTVFPREDRFLIFDCFW